MMRLDAFTHYPDSIGKLVNLKTWRIIFSESLVALPDTIGNLQALRELDCGNNKHLTRLPESISLLTDLVTDGP